MAERGQRSARPELELEPEPGARSGAGAEPGRSGADRAEPAAELGARAGGMYRARAARAGPEPGSPGRFGILSTGQLRDLLQDEPKLDRIVRLSRKVTRGARAGGGCGGDGEVGLRPAGTRRPSQRRPPPWSCQASRSWEPGTSEWAPRSRPRGMGGAPIQPGASGAEGGRPGMHPCTPGWPRGVPSRGCSGEVCSGGREVEGELCCGGPWLSTPTFNRARKGRCLARGRTEGLLDTWGGEATWKKGWG